MWLESRRWVWWLFFSLAFTFPIFFHLTWMGGWDQTYFHALDEAARHTILQYGQFPLWNPYHCGGRTLVGHIANVHLHPMFWFLVLPLGTAIAYKLYLFLHIFVGIWGMDVYLRERGADSTGALFGAVIFGTNGYFAWHFAGGHVSYYGLTLIPWIMLCLDRSRTHIRYGAWTGLLLASTLLMAGAYSYPFEVLFVAIHVVIFTLRDRSFKPFLAASLAAIVSIGVSAIKLLPALDFASKHGRPSPILQSIAPHELFTLLLSRSHDYGRWGHHAFTWPEYGAYIGYIALFLACAAVAFKPRHMVYFAGMALFFALLSMGKYFGPFSPYVWLRKLPVYKDLRLPSRYMIFVIFYLSALAAFALTAWSRRAFGNHAHHPPGSWRRHAPTLVMLLGIAEVISFGCVELYRTYKVIPITPTPQQTFYHTYIPNPQEGSYIGPYRNLGIANCYEEAANPKSPALRTGPYTPQVYLANRTHGTVKMTKWTPNRIQFRTQLKRPTLVVFNQNFSPHWRVGSWRSTNYNGLTAFQLPAGTHSVEARYLPRPFTIGWILSLLSIFALLVGFGWLKRKNRQRGILSWRYTLWP